MMYDDEKVRTIRKKGKMILACSRDEDVKKDQTSDKNILMLLLR